MKLALIRQRYTPFGGAERFVDLALDGLRQAGVETTLITRHWAGEWNGQVQRVAPFYIGRLWRDAGFSRAVRDKLSRERFDLVQSHERIPGCHIFRAGDGVHATWLEQLGKLGGLKERMAIRISPYHRYLLQTERALFRHPALRAVICNSRMVATDIQRRFGIAPERLHVIHNAVDHARFNPGLASQFRRAVRQHLDCSLACRIWLLIGSGYRRKGVAEALQALADLPEDHLWIIGYDSQSDRFRKLAEKLGVIHRVRFLGPQKDVRPFLGAADAFVLPSWYDPFPNAGLEALASGLPVVTTTACGVAELIMPGANGALCSPGDVTDLLRQMQLLRPRLGEPAVSEAAVAAVSALRSKDMLSKLTAIYDSLITHQ